MEEVVKLQLGEKKWEIKNEKSFCFLWKQWTASHLLQKAMKHSHESVLLYWSAYPICFKHFIALKISFSLAYKNIWVLPEPW